jgi:hypothetical protein
MLFISHDQDDIAPLSQVRMILKYAGIEHWDPQTMSAGKQLREQLRQAIQKCDVCLFLATRRSIGSSWCKAELGAFWGAGKRVISLLQDPELTDASLPPQLQGDLFTRDAAVAFDAIRESIDTARRNQPPSDAEIKASVCRVRAEEHMAATGYLVADSLIICPFLSGRYRPLSIDDTATVKFFGDKNEIDAHLILNDEHQKIAVLRLDTKPQHLRPLRLVENATIGTVCRGLGYPHLANGASIPFHCEVIEPDSVDGRGAPCIAVQSSIFSTGSMQGFDGSPVWNNAGVIGHLESILTDRSTNFAAFGIAFVTPPFRILETLSPVVDIATLTRR